MRTTEPESINEIVAILKRHNKNIRERFKAKDLAVFGSYIRDEQEEGSDVDILVEFDQGYKTFDNYMELKFFLEALLNSKVDLIIKTALRDELRQSVLSETIYV